MLRLNIDPNADRNFHITCARTQLAKAKACREIGARKYAHSLLISAAWHRAKATALPVR